MSFSYNDFVQLVKSDGLAYQNRFFIIIGMPRKLYGQSASLFASTASTSNRKLHLLCKSVTINGVNIATVPVRLTGEVYELPYDRNFTTASFQFYVDRSLIVRQFFEDWVNTIQNPETKILSYYKDYIVNIDIFIENKSQKLSPVYKIQLREAFPKQIGAITLDQETSGIMTLNVDINFHNYKTELITRVNVPENKSIPGALKNLPKASDNLRNAPGMKSNDFSVSDRPSTIINPIDNLFDRYPFILQDYNNNFRDFQEYISSSMVNENQTGIPLQQIFSSNTNNTENNYSNKTKKFSKNAIGKISREIRSPKK